MANASDPTAMGAEPDVPPPPESPQGPDPAHAWTALVIVFAREQGHAFLTRQQSSALIKRLVEQLNGEGYECACLESPLLDMTPFLRHVQESAKGIDPATGLLEVRHGL